MLAASCVDAPEESDLAEGDTEDPADDPIDDDGEPVDTEGASEPQAGPGELSDSADPQALATDPVLRWILVPTPGSARLMTFDPATQSTNLLVSVNHANASWTPISVAGDKLLWRNDSNGAVEVWTLSAAGVKTSFTTLALPGAGDWRPRGISLNQDGQCPQGAATYTVLWEKIVSPATPGALWPKPVLYQLNGAGTYVSQETLPDAYPNALLRDFRRTNDGFAMLAYRPLFGDGKVTWYERVGNAWLRLRSDTYSATAGMTACTAHAPGVLCPESFVDEAPGAGHKLASVLMTANAFPLGGLPTIYHLWTKTDGTAKILRLDSQYSGPLLSPATAIATNQGAVSVASFAGALPPICP